MTNVLRLPQSRGSDGHPSETEQRMGQVRQQLWLLQGYSDLMQGLSPRVQHQVLSVLAEKTRELSELLAPFTQEERRNRPDIEHYRQARQRSRQLIADYRSLLGKLHEIVETRPESSA
ncbi:MAG TPA: hypothetical protein VFR68_06060 [Candidatus Dormibacteraeota bacterium]|nr:hypothetical protein [Candidatus Dormibacteraeota bacterium]